MYSDRDLERLLLDDESDMVERKPNEKQSDSIRKAVCAFSNDIRGTSKPGVVFVGVNDDGSFSGVVVSDQILRSLADIRSDGNILPMPRLSVEQKTLRGQPLAVMTVWPHDAPPVRYKGVVYVRVGPSNRVANDADERVLNEKRRGKDLPYDLRALASASVSDLDFEWFTRQYLPAAISLEDLDANGRTPIEQLTSLRLCSPEPGAQPTVLGILVAGKDPLSLIPCAYVQFLRIDGTELSEPIKDQKDVSGRVSVVLDEIDEILKAHISIGTDIRSGSREIQRPDFPLVALQQLVRNAVLHRTYEATNAPVRITWFIDRIEIQSPGGPYGQVTLENFAKPGVTDYRNPHLAEALKNLGYVQKFGIGIPVARKELEKNGNPELEYVVEPSHVMAIVRKTQ